LAGTAVLVVHGFTANPKTVGHIAGFLERAGLPYEIPTLRGHGTRMEDLETVRWQDWYADAEAAYDRLEKAHGSVAVVGHSMGALAGGVMAARKPKMAALVMVAPAMEYSNPLAYLVPMLGAVVKYWSWGPSSVTDPALRAQSEAEKITYPRFPVKAFGEMLKLRQVTMRDLPQVRVPAMVIQSRLDKSLPASSAEKSFALLGSADKKLAWVEQGGHEVFWDVARDEFCQVIVDFVQSKTPVSST
jgi:carboxylesterase